MTSLTSCCWQGHSG
ncbi:hypothetical protein Nmel_001560, partial [Mimus melanotis]